MPRIVKMEHPHPVLQAYCVSDPGDKVNHLRSPHTTAGHAALLHAIAHIELNAINLVLDAILRFDERPEPYCHDRLNAAPDSARHFSLLADHLRTLGNAYGDFPARDGLWSMDVLPPRGRSNDLLRWSGCHGLTTTDCWSTSATLPRQS